MESYDKVIVIFPTDSSAVVFDNMVVYLPVLGSKAGRFMPMDVAPADYFIEDSYCDPEWVLSIDGFIEYTEYH